MSLAAAEGCKREVVKGVISMVRCIAIIVDTEQYSDVQSPTKVVVSSARVECSVTRQFTL